MVVGLTNDKLSKYAVSWEILGQLFININYYKLTIVILRQKHGLEDGFKTHYLHFANKKKNHITT